MTATVLAFLAPLGIAMVLWGGMPERKARGAAARLLAVLALTTLGFWASGFALQYGGIGCLHDLPGLEAVQHEFPLWNLGPSWGLAGTEGWLLNVPAGSLEGVLGLFLAQLPWLAVLTVVAGLGLVGRERGAGSWLIVLVLAAAVGPLAAGWAWAGGPSAAAQFLCARPEDQAAFDVNFGGWLGNLGVTAGWGHGFVDYAGSGTLFLLAGAVGLAGALILGPRRPPDDPAQPVEMPPVHLPLIAVAGLVLWFLGWLSLPLEHPLYTGLSWPVIALNGLLALGAGTLAAQLYSAFTAGRADVLMAVRGGAAGLVAISAAAPFVAPWGAFVIGLLAGAVVPVLHYIVEHVWRREDLTASISVFLAAGLWGLIALGLLADGQHGAGWNALGREEFLGTPPQGVSGLIVAPGLVSDTRQIFAQLVGAAAIFLTGFVPAACVFLLMRLPAWLADARRRQLAALAAAKAAAAEAAAGPEGLDALLAGIEPRPEQEAAPEPIESAASAALPEPEHEPEPGPSVTE